MKKEKLYLYDIDCSYPDSTFEFTENGQLYFYYEDKKGEVLINDVKTIEIKNEDDRIEISIDNKEILYIPNTILLRVTDNKIFIHTSISCDMMMKYKKQQDILEILKYVNDIYDEETLEKKTDEEMLKIKRKVKQIKYIFDELRNL
ncbi:hypothetical protein [Tepidibacter hydrothermalis]|uniref:Uncharacterized protein n=1 Tax=Tepidibacter hydrothermalis TaxID=3036126 RepID=A0ABY8EFW9_9FIRM|nr:hypothetical protein [Tepidibacter hydrothermalis]WFD11831.1 hypothetical protein P4S50_07070 [Tepidibacter hydrothermalis]